MIFDDTTENLVKLAVDHLTKLGFINITVDDNEDTDAKDVGPPPADPHRHWYLVMSGTDSKYVDNPGIDVIFIRPPSEGLDDAITLKDFDHLDLLLVKEGYLGPTQ